MPDPIRLDEVGTPAGLRERLFLHETLTPAFARYDREEAFHVMWFIRQVLANRVAHPRVFGIRGTVRSEADLMAIPNQFPGFETYPRLSAAEMTNVNECVRLANATGDRRQSAYRQHVQDAITVATAPAVPIQYSAPTAAAWKRAGTPSPGAKFTLYRTMQGNDYYTTPMS